jgi:RNA recognition motif-containing protein
LNIVGIHWDFHTVDSIRQHFEIFGEVEQVEIVGHPRGHGFVVFEESAAAQQCLEYNQTHIVNGKKIEVRVSEKKCWLCSL